ALLKRQIELSVSLSVSEARCSFQSVASNGEERARNSIVTCVVREKRKIYSIGRCTRFGGQPEMHCELKYETWHGDTASKF
ncbi:hypothetical protein SFRURICE_019323, partial [Spodoptera frugiperda]